MEWAGRTDHMWGIPRKMMFMAVGAFAKTVANLLNTTSVRNADTLLRLVRYRPPGVPLITVSNHMSTSVSFSLSAASFSLAIKLLSLLYRNLVLLLRFVYSLIGWISLFVSEISKSTSLWWI